MSVESVEKGSFFKNEEKRKKCYIQRKLFITVKAIIQNWGELPNDNQQYVVMPNF